MMKYGIILPLVLVSALSAQPLANRTRKFTEGTKVCYESARRHDYHTDRAIFCDDSSNGSGLDTYETTLHIYRDNGMELKKSVVHIIDRPHQNETAKPDEALFHVPRFSADANYLEREFFALRLLEPQATLKKKK